MVGTEKLLKEKKYNPFFYKINSFLFKKLEKLIIYFFYFNIESLLKLIYSFFFRFNLNLVIK